jgi:hypothetical protein
MYQHVCTYMEIYPCGERTFGQESKRIRRIARNPPLDGLHPLPLALRRANLQPRNMLRKQQRQTPKIRVPALTVPLRLIPLFLRAHVVDHVAQVVVRAIVVRVGVAEVVFGELENDAHQHEELVRDFLEQVPVERGDFLVVLLHDFVARDRVPFGDCFGDVQLYHPVSTDRILYSSSRLYGGTHHLNIILDPRIANPPRILTIPKVLALGKITGEKPLLLNRLLEERIAKAKLPQDALVVDPVARNDPEPDAR